MKVRPRGGLIADDRVDFELGADIDAAHRIVHQNDRGIRPQSPGEQRLLLVSA